MTLLIVSFMAGVLTVAAPCILPLLPLIVGGTLTTEGESRQKSWYRPLVIVGSLVVSVIIFSLLLKATTVLLDVPQAVWSVISGVIIVILGITLIFPSLWDKFMALLRLNVVSNDLLGASYKRHGLSRDVLVGASLGPVFNSCSPTYALIVAVILPESFARGFAYLVAYALGLGAVLLLIAVIGQTATQRMKWLSNPEGWFRRVVGILFIIVGIAVISGLDRDFQTYVLQNGWYDPIMKIEQNLGLE